MTGMSVLICAAGDIHGAIERLYDDVLAFEAALGARFEWVLHVGDFGIWPDPEKIDRGTRNHGGAGDFSKWLAAARPVPRPTVFIKGNHEDFAWLDAHNNTEVLPGLVHLRNGQVRAWMSYLCMMRRRVFASRATGAVPDMSAKPLVSTSCWHVRTRVYVSSAIITRELTLKFRA